MKQKNLLKILQAAQGKYDGAIGGVEQKLFDKIEFEFAIFYQPSDGFVVLHCGSAKNAPLDLCIKEIEENGVLTYEKYERLCI